MTLPIDPGAKKRCKSAAVIAKMLSTEGFTEHLANQVDRYYAHAAGLTKRQRAQFQELAAEFRDIVGELPIGDRMIVGKFIGYQKKAAFDTGLRIGLGAFVARNGQEVDIELPTPNPSRETTNTGGSDGSP